VRTKLSVLLLLVILGIAITATVTGQEEPLPILRLHAVPGDPSPIVLAVYPIREPQQPTLADAVRRNDYVTFHALYEETQPAEYRALYELWTWAIEDPVGAFYGPEMYERFARAYPGYASFIEPHRIVDSRGNVFYPTSETRTFLLQRALENDAPPVMIAGDAPQPLPVVGQESAEPRVVTPAASGTRRRPAATGSVAVKTPVQTTIEPAIPALVAEPAPEVVPAIATPAPAPALVTPAPAVPAPVSRTPIKGLLLLIIGLLGVILLAVILRAPRSPKAAS
jgi:hypothetical protein